MAGPDHLPTRVQGFLGLIHLVLKRLSERVLPALPTVGCTGEAGAEAAVKDGGTLGGALA